MASNAAAMAKLNEQIARIRAIPKLAKAAAPEIAAEVKRSLDASIRAGTDPDGNPWPATKDGHAPLTDAARAVTVTPVGSSIVIRLTGKEVYHHTGQTRGHVRRRIIPTRGIPGPISDAIKTVLDRRFDELMKGGARG